MQIRGSVRYLIFDTSESFRSCIATAAKYIGFPCAPYATRTNRCVHFISGFIRILRATDTTTFNNASNFLWLQ
jgi:hypothetical protein